MRPKRSLGQNFLIDNSVIERIVDALDIANEDHVVEIGPGRGALTEKLLAKGPSVTAIEIDRQLVPALRTQFHFDTRFKVVEADVLEIDLSSTVPTPFTGNSKLVGNLPYYISTAILQKLLIERDLFGSMVVMLQREVADRIMAAPGNSERGYLTVLIEASMKVKKLFDVPPSAFNPRPKVWSSIIELTPLPQATIDNERFRQIVSASFAQKRKTILNNLRSVFPNSSTALELANIDPLRRAETLSIDEWRKLIERL